MFAITIENLTKKFNGLIAVDNISFNIEKGEIFGLLGPNGAGKTTTISMLATMLTPTAGKAFVNGFDVNKNQDEVRNSIGIVFQDQSLDEELTAYENMDFHGRLYRIPKKTREKRIIELLQLVGLEDRENDLVKTFSGGMKRRLEIARGLLHEPKILFLDEPTLGLDSQTRNHIWQYIKKLNEEKNITIVLTTHYMEEADKLCHRVAIIDKGKIIALNTPTKLKEEIGGDIIAIETQNTEKLEAVLKQLPWIKKTLKHNNNLTINLQNADKHVVDIIKLSQKHEVEVLSLSIHKPTLEDVFLHFTGKTIREEEASVKDKLRLRHKMQSR